MDRLNINPNRTREGLCRFDLIEVDDVDEIGNCKHFSLCEMKKLKRIIE